MGKENIWSSWGIAEICQNKKEWKTFLASLPYFNTFVNISYKIEMENFYMRNSKNHILVLSTNPIFRKVFGKYIFDSQELLKTKSF